MLHDHASLELSADHFTQGAAAILPVCLSWSVFGTGSVDALIAPLGYSEV